MRLIDWVKSKDRYVVFPLNCLPGMKLVGEDIDKILHNPELKVSAALAFAERFEPDLIFFPNDVAVEAEALGAAVKFSNYGMPVIGEYPVKDMNDLNKLKLPDPYNTGRMPLNIETVSRLARKVPNRYKVAHVIGPFTVAGQLTGVDKLARKTINDPSFTQALLEITSETVIRYARTLVEAGADVLYVAEPSASLISPFLFRKYLAEHLKRLFNSVKAMNFLHICGDTTYLVEELAAIGTQGLSFDNRVNLLKIENKVPADVVIIGNIDPVGVIKNSNPQVIKKAVESLLKEMLPVKNFALSAGCAIPFETPFENIKAFFKAGRNFPRPLPEAIDRLSLINQAVINADSKSVAELTEKALAEEISPLQILYGSLVRSIRQASLNYEEKSLHIPELLLIVDAMNAGYEIIKPALEKEKIGYQGRVIIGTAKGDIHDIGKNLVSTMLEASGFEVFDLGVNVSEQKFLEGYQKHLPDIIGISSFTTVSAEVISSIIKAFKRENLQKVKFLIGGAAVTSEYAREVGADGYASDAVSAVEKVREILDLEVAAVG